MTLLDVIFKFTNPCNNQPQGRVLKGWKSKPELLQCPIGARDLNSIHLRVLQLTEMSCKCNPEGK